MDKSQVLHVLRDIAQRIQLQPSGKDTRRKVQAYRHAADAIVAYQGDFQKLVAEKKVQQLPGVGPGTERIVEELYQTGHSSLLERLRNEVPDAVVQLTLVRGISAPQARALHEQLGVETTEALAEACRKQRVRNLPGFGPKTEARLLAAIEQHTQHQDTGLLLYKALKKSQELIAFFQSLSSVQCVAVTGDLRRGLEIVPRIELVLCAYDKQQLLRDLEDCPGMISANSTDDSSITLYLAESVNVQLHLTLETDFAKTLLHSTGSQAHLRALDALAGGRLNEVATQNTEAEIYQCVGLPFIEPELRDDSHNFGSLTHASEPLVSTSDIRGIVHCHTTYSDGKESILRMAQAVEALGYNYLTITDHSAAASYAGGLSIERLRQQWDEIAEVQTQTSVRLLRGTESDILKDGALDYPDAVLEQLDVVIASIHARHRLDREAMTQRLVRAMKHPFFKIWGHPLGRLVSHRPPIDCDVEAVLDAAAESRAAIEINGDPYRLDLEPRWAHAAAERGLKFVVSVDAHSIRNLDSIQYGVIMARRAGLRPSQVLNTLDAHAFADHVRPA